MAGITINYRGQQRPSPGLTEFTGQPNSAVRGVIVSRSPDRLPLAQVRSSCLYQCFERPAFGEAARMRRSAVDLVGGLQAMSLSQLSAMPQFPFRPFSADFADARLCLN